MTKGTEQHPEAETLAAYTIGEAAHYLRLPPATVRAWAVGRRYPTRSGQKPAAPVLVIPSKKPPMLSFLNMVEMHVLAAMTRDALDLYLARIEWDASGLASRLFPFTGRAHPNAPRSVMIDPRVAFGKPVLAGTSIPTLAIAERFKAGESEAELAFDYGRHETEIEEAIRCELYVAA